MAAIFPTISAILKFQRAVRDAELERRHRKETDPWDAELARTPPLPKDWERWVNKVGIQANYIFYDYCRGGTKHGYCTYANSIQALHGLWEHLCNVANIFEENAKEAFLPTYFSEMISH